MRQFVLRALRRAGYELHRDPAYYRGRLLRDFGIDLVFDVGAASGRYVQELRRFGFTGQAVSFEPLSAAFRVLNSAAAKDPRWMVHRTALGACAGSADLHVAANGDSSSLLPMLGRHLEAAPHTRYGATERVDVARLDDIAPDYLRRSRSALLKVDTQGYEREVLAGATDTLPRLRGLALEVSFVPLYQGGMLYEEAFAFVADCGFAPVSVEPGLRDRRSGQLLQADVLFMRLDRP